jgi:hypothetical protein
MIKAFVHLHSPLPGCGHHKLSPLGRALWPALHDGLLLGIKAHTFFAVSMHVAKQATASSRQNHARPWVLEWVR